MDTEEKNDNTVAVSTTSTETFAVIIPNLNSVTSPTVSIKSLTLPQQPTVAAHGGGIGTFSIRTVSSPASSTTKPTETDTNQDVPDHENTVIPGDDDSNASTKFSREHKQLQDSINSSKVLTECIIEGRRSRNRRKSIATTKEKSKSPDNERKSRARSVSRSTRSVSRTPSVSGPAQSPFSSTPTIKSQESNGNKSRKGQKRSNMRSSNAEFIQKQQQFLQKISAQDDTGDDDSGDDDAKSVKSMRSVKSIQSVKSNVTVGSVTKHDLQPPPKEGSDRFCWRCFQGNQLIACSKCIRSYHFRCMKGSQAPLTPNTSKWKCPECVELEVAEKLNKGKPKFDMEFLQTLLNLVYNRMAIAKGSEQLTRPSAEIKGDPLYEQYIVNPMSLDILKENIDAKKYRSPEAFHLDARWLLHNTTVFPPLRKYMTAAKSVLKACKQELLEIETCFECYYKANNEENWFIDVCSRPHILIWAKLKGFPFWPAKAMSVNQQGLVNVRFFGAHDRSWIPVKDCYLYSDEDPNENSRFKRNDMAESIKEVDIHIEKLIEIYGVFKKAPPRTPFDPSREQEQLQQMLPNVNKVQRRPDTHQLVQDIINTPDNQPKLKLKIIRAADNSLSTTSGKNSPSSEHELAPTKIKITTDSKRGGAYQVVPVVKDKIPELTVKRNAESWTVSEKIDSHNKKRKHDLDEQQRIFTDALQLRPTKAGESPTRKRGRPNKSLTENQADTSAIRAAKLKRSSEDLNNPHKTVSPEEVPLSDRRVLRNRNKSTAEPGKTNKHNSTAATTSSTTVNEMRSPEKPTTSAGKNLNSSQSSSSIFNVSSTSTGSNRSSLYGSKPTTSPPPLVPLEGLIIKTEPLSDNEEPLQSSSSAKDNSAQKKIVYLTPIDKQQPTINRSNSLNSNLLSNSISLERSRKRMNSGNQRNLSTTANTNEPYSNNAVPANQNGNGMVSIPVTQLESAPSIANGPSVADSGTASSESNHSNDLNGNPIHALSGSLTNAMAATISEIIANGPPKLMQRPSGALRSDGSYVFPSEAGPVSRVLIDNAHRMTDFFRTVIEDTLSDLGSAGILEAKVRKLELEIEQLKQDHAREVTLIKNNSDLILNELKTSMDKQKQKLINEVRKQCDVERIRAVDEAKRKQWCANCLREANSHCCFSTWYCGRACQQKHWVKHQPECEQTKHLETSIRLQKPQPQHQAQQQVAQQQKSQQQKFIQPNRAGGSSQFLNDSLVRFGSTIQQRTLIAPQMSKVQGKRPHPAVRKSVSKLVPQVPGSNLAPLPRPGSSGGFMISSEKQLKTQPFANKFQKTNVQKPQSLLQKYRSVNGNVLPASEVNPVTITPIAPVKDLTISAHPSLTTPTSK